LREESQHIDDCAVPREEGKHGRGELAPAKGTHPEGKKQREGRGRDRTLEASKIGSRGERKEVSRKGEGGQAHRTRRSSGNTEQKWLNWVEWTWSVGIGSTAG